MKDVCVWTGEETDMGIANHCLPHTFIFCLLQSPQVHQAISSKYDKWVNNYVLIGDYV